MGYVARIASAQRLAFTSAGTVQPKTSMKNAQAVRDTADRMAARTARQRTPDVSRDSAAPASAPDAITLADALPIGADVDKRTAKAVIESG